MGVRRRQILGSGAAMLAARGARAQAPTESLRIGVAAAANGLDPHSPATNQAGRGVAWMVYDRLFGFGTQQASGEDPVFDSTTPVPELAEYWTVASDGMSVLIRLRAGAVFHDNSPVEASDVVWSLSRAVAVGGPSGVLARAGFTRSEQFSALNPATVRVDFGARGDTALTALALPQAAILNADPCQKRVAAGDAWAAAFLQSNVCGGGAYRMDAWTPGTDAAAGRFELWRSGQMPAFHRVVVQEGRSVSGRQSWLRGGDVEAVPDLGLLDAVAVLNDPRLVMPRMKLANTMVHLGMHTRMPPFDDIRVRQAIAAALPYDRIEREVMLGRGRRLWGAAEGQAPLPSWPQPFPIRTQPDRVRALLRSAGYGAGIEITLSYAPAPGGPEEALVALLRQALGGQGIRVVPDRRAAAEMPGLIARRELPLYLHQAAVSPDRPEDFFAALYAGFGPAAANGAAYARAEMDASIRKAMSTRESGVQDQARRSMAALAIQDMPYIPLWQPFWPVVTRSSLAGLVGQPLQQVDARSLLRAVPPG